MVLSSDLTVYTQQILNFLKTVTIKYSPLADLINDTVIRNGYTVNLDDPTTWKYNLNAIGEYHESDTQMTVISLDTRETIVFSKDTLAVHVRTASAYRPGSDYFSALCATYPAQTDLIKSILFPCPSMEDWLDMDDISLANYASGYLEEWEEPELINRLVTFLGVIRERWHFNFLNVEPYFAPTFFGQLYAQMAAFLMVSRDSLIRTPYVHSWHIWQYLQSNGLDNYSDILGRKKSLFLYQNWEYLKVNMGKQSNLVILIDNLLSDINVGIYGRKVIEQTYTGQATYQLTPQLSSTNVLNDNQRDLTIADESIIDMQTRLYEANLIPANTDDLSAAVTRQLGDTTRNEWFTKFLELRPTTADTRYSDMLNRFILDNLVQTCAAGIYASTDEVLDPLSGHSEIMSVADRLLLFAYCSAKAVGLTLTNLPTDYITSYSLRTTFLDPGTTYPYYGYHRNIASYVDAQTFMTNVTYPQIIGAATDFSNELTSLWEVFIQQIQDCEQTDDTFLYDLKMYLLWCRYNTYEAIPLNLAPGYTTFASWLDVNYPALSVLFTNMFDISDSPQTAYSNLADTIISTLVPSTAVLNFYGNYTISDAAYARLRALFIQLCSYNVNFIDFSQVNSEYLTFGKYTNDQIQLAAVETVSQSSYVKWGGLKTANYTENMVIDTSMIIGDNTMIDHSIDLDTAQNILVDQSDNTNDSDILQMRWYASTSDGNHADMGSLDLAFDMIPDSLISGD